MKKFSDIITLVKNDPPLLFEKLNELESAPDTEPWTSIKKIESQDGLVFKCMAAIANGALTNKKTEFLFSRRILQEMLARLYIERVISVSGTSYSKALAQLTDPKVGFMVCINKPNSCDLKRPKAGTYKLTNEILTKYIEALKSLSQ